MFEFLFDLSLGARALLSGVTALVLAWGLGPIFIRYVTRHFMGQAVRDDGPQTHLKKQGTPTMGGVFLLVAVIASVALWADVSNRFIYLAVGVMVAFGLIGGVDDYRKMVLKSPKGLPARWKYFWQTVAALAVVAGLCLTGPTPINTDLVIPFVKGVTVSISVLYFVLAYFVLVGTSNAVNLTDGLDGLVIVPVMLAMGGFALCAYLSSDLDLSMMWYMPHVEGASELLVLASAVVGGGLGFLWFNAYPAQVFMGDVGSLSLGALLGFMAIAVRQELLLVLMGGLFVAETLSVIAQVLYFKLTGGKRILRMAPLHHHFELKGWSEPKVVVRFWCVAFLLFVLSIWVLLG